MAKKSKKSTTNSPVKKVEPPTNPPIRTRWSQRKYPEIMCLNPLCPNGRVFEPHDKRQRYCCLQCGIDHRNDLRDEANRTIYADEKTLRKTDRKLGMIHDEHFDGMHCLIHISIFRLYKVDLRFLVKYEPNKDTKMKILWLYKFGTERHHEDENYYYILKRQIKNA